MMTDRVKMIARRLQDYAFQHVQGVPSASTHPVEHFALAIEGLLNECESLKKEQDEWKARYEAAQRDIREMLIGNGSCMFCGNFATDKCSWESCPDVATWRGPCAGNGGAQDGNQADPA